MAGSGVAEGTTSELASDDARVCGLAFDDGRAHALTAIAIAIAAAEVFAKRAPLRSA
jgi:hypothetical protein